MSKELITIDIGSKYTKIMVGSSQKVHLSQRVLTPESTFMNDKLANMDELSQAIRTVLLSKRITTKNVAFVVRGRDIIIRHIDIPAMSVDKIDETVKWEINQYLPDIDSDYYIDYEIIDKASDKSIKNFRVMVAAAPKAKIDKCIELSKKLKLNLLAVDVAANSVARVFSNIYKTDRTKQSIGVLDIGNKTTTITILDKGSLFIERDISFGISDMIGELISNFSVEPDKELEFFFNKFNFLSLDLENEIILRVKNRFDSLLEMFQKIIMFYNSGKATNMLDCVYIIGAGCELIGIQKYMREYLGVEVKVVDSMTELKYKTQVQYGFSVKDYINCFGMCLRNSTSNLNLLPDTMKKTKANLVFFKKVKIVAAIMFLLIVASSSLIYGYLLKLQQKDTALDAVIASNAEVQRQNNLLNAEKNSFEGYINKVKLLTENKQILSKKVRGLEKYIPADVSLEAVIYSGGNYTISAKATNYNAVSVCGANLQTSEEYYDTRIKNVTSADGVYAFNIVIRGE